MAWTQTWNLGQRTLSLRLGKTRQQVPKPRVYSHARVCATAYVSISRDDCPDCLDRSTRKSAFQEQQALDAHGKEKRKSNLKI